MEHSRRVFGLRGDSLGREAMIEPAQEPQRAISYNDLEEQRNAWAKQCNYASERASAAEGRAVEAEAKLADLAMMVRRLALALRKAKPFSPIPRLAVDLLKRHGLEGSILRKV
jgi:hypothetical protein